MIVFLHYFQKPRGEVHDEPRKHGDEEKESEKYAIECVDSDDPCKIHEGKDLWKCLCQPRDDLDEPGDSDEPEGNTVNSPGPIGNFSDSHTIILLYIDSNRLPCSPVGMNPCRRE